VSENPIQALMKTAMESIKAMVDVNTIVGDAVQAEDGTLVIPISRVSFGFAAGGGEFSMSAGNSNSSDGNQQAQDSSSTKFPFAGGSGAGVSIQPMAFMVVAKENIRLMSVCPSNSVDKLIDLVPDMITKVNDFITNKMDSGNSGECNKSSESNKAKKKNNEE